MNNYEEMRIESDVFATARENFDLLMQRLFKSMDDNVFERYGRQISNQNSGGVQS